MTLVFAPPLGASGAVWEAQGEGIRYEPRVVPRTLDDLGHEVLRIAPGRFSFCGLSLGGLIGMWIAVHAPERLDRLVLACTAAHFPPPEKWEQRAALVRRGGSVEPLAEMTVARWVSDPRPDLVEMVARSSPDVYAGCCDVLAHADVRDRLAEIVAPTLVISGDRDEATPPEVAPRIPDARYAVIAGAAHLANVDRPDEFNRLLLGHLRPASPPAAR